MAVTPDAVAPARGRATTWVALGAGVAGLATYAFQVVGTRALGTEAYAPIGVLWTIQYLVFAVGMVAVEAYVTRATTLHPHTLRHDVRVVAVWLISAAVIVGAVTLALRGALFNGLSDLALIAALIVLAFGSYAVVRGELAGAERFRAYGLVTVAEATTRVVLAIGLVFLAAATTRSLAWVLPVGPLLLATWWTLSRNRTARVGPSGRSRPRGGSPLFPDTASSPDPSGEKVVTKPLGEAGPLHRGGDQMARPGSPPIEGTAPTTWATSRFLLATTTANGASQFLLAGGPLVLLPLGAGAVEVSIFFVTITAARTPVSFALGGVLSRILPPLVRMFSAGDQAGLRRIVVAMATATLVVAVLGGAVALFIGQDLVAILFGDAFRPGPLFVALAGAGVLLATGSLVLNQVLIATHCERALPVPWLVALAVAAVVVIVAGGSATDRVALAFVAGELVALLGLTAAAIRATGQAGSSGWSSSAS